jgi:hypothetical protein
MRAITLIFLGLGLVCLLGCAPGSHPEAEVSARVDTRRTHDSRRETRGGDKRILPLPDDHLLGAQSLAERDAIAEALILEIGEYHRGRVHYFGFCERVGQPGREGDLRYYDPNPAIVRAVMPPGGEIEPLSACDGGTQILIWHISVETNHATVDVTLPGSPSPMECRYGLWFKEGAWQVPKKEKGVVVDFWVD